MGSKDVDTRKREKVFVVFNSYTLYTQNVSGPRTMFAQCGVQAQMRVGECACVSSDSNSFVCFECLFVYVEYGERVF